MRKLIALFTFSFLMLIPAAQAQDYFLAGQGPFNPDIPSPEEYLEYPIGSQHTRHDMIVSYLKMLAQVSDRATITTYGKTHEGRKLVMLTVSTPQNLQNLESIKAEHLKYVDPKQSPSNYDALPVFIQLGYNVHGNEPSSSEAALFTAYTLVASNNPEVLNYLENGIIMIDPTINPDGRDRHTQWANQYKATPFVADPMDAEHWEAWPRGRTNHYWFDLNRDWLLGINPESRGKLTWYHQWYPNVVTDFHEMGTNSTYFFEPMKPIGSLDPIMPKENYEDLNELFATYYEDALNGIGSFYFTKEAFDGTYPGYGSSYPDLQGALALLFEQASSRGHVQETAFGEITFGFTIRNQYTSSMATVQAAVENKATLRKYQQDFFKSAVNEKAPTGYAAYTFNKGVDGNRMKAFIDKLLLHEIEVYKSGDQYSVPLAQPQRRMVQSFFETYKSYRDSVFYDASAWSVANFYNVPYKGQTRNPGGTAVSSTDGITNLKNVPQSSYAYLMDWNDYNAPAALYHLQAKGLVVNAAFKPFSIVTHQGKQNFDYGTVMIPVSKQNMSAAEVYAIVKEAEQSFEVPLYAVNTGYSAKGIDLGSRNFRALEQPKAALLIGNGVNSYEAGEVWHLLDTRVHMPITKLQMRTFSFADLDRYNTLVMVSGSYRELDSTQIERLKSWVGQGNTLITIANASRWAVSRKLVSEKLTQSKDKKDSTVGRKPYVDAGENIGRERVGGVILETDLDLTHPLGFGYTSRRLPVYKNNMVFLQPSGSAYSTVAKYTANPHIDGFISPDNLEQMIKPSASLIVSPVGGGRVVMFADNPNFRGSWYGTNRLFLNALFLGSEISVPRD
jgi:hypothetical protein